MRFAIITHVRHIRENDQYFAYGPYVREMNLWLKYADSVEVVAPMVNDPVSPIHLPYTHDAIQFSAVAEFNITSITNIFKSLVKLPSISWTIIKAMKKADHIHLRCPGNMGLLGAILQIFFPSKKKTAKYAGNWDPSSRQPLTYKLQRWILANTFLTKNMQVLVYGEWKGSSKNIKPFFTATYSESDKAPLIEKPIDKELKFMFVGTLSKGKQPLYAIDLIREVRKLQGNATLAIFGDGKLREIIESYISEKKVSDFIHLKGNQTKETVQQAYQESHFLLLPSLSEGWPKVVAEAMFWGCVPVATKVSCVPYMLDYGKRGIVLNLNLESDADKILQLAANAEQYNEMMQKGAAWSREFTIDKFETEIQKLIH